MTFLVVGLGNPGRKFVGTRHNIGFAVVQELAKRHGAVLRGSRGGASTAEIRVGDFRAVLAMPQTFMNESGRSVAALIRRYNIDDLPRLIVVHDELDLPPGTLRLKEGGGLAGHNGLRSVTSHLGSRDYLRVRVGVGKPSDSNKGADYVLRRPGKLEQTVLDGVVGQAAEAIEMILTTGIGEAMGSFNARP